MTAPSPFFGGKALGTKSSGTRLIKVLLLGMKMWIALIDWFRNSRGNNTRDWKNDICLDRTVNATGFVLFHFGMFSSIVYIQVQHDFCELFNFVLERCVSCMRTIVSYRKSERAILVFHRRWCHLFLVTNRLHLWKRRADSWKFFICFLIIFFPVGCWFS